MNNVTWYVQSNLISHSTFQALKEAVLKIGAIFSEMKVIPFSDELDVLIPDSNPFIFYGSTTLILNAYKNESLKKGIFYHPESFSMKNYLSNWKDHMLNSDGKIVSAKELLTTELFEDGISYFIRPNLDDKLFTGTVVLDMKEFKRNLQSVIEHNPQASEQTEFFISSPKKIEKEWRNFIVDGKVISSSRYCVDGELSKSSDDIPEEMIKFVESCTSTYSPHPIFVMDIGFCDGKYGIIECNTFNGTGFYDHDINAIVEAVTSFCGKIRE